MIDSVDLLIALDELMFEFFVVFSGSREKWGRINRMKYYMIF